jgi:hypothetical protein
VIVFSVLGNLLRFSVINSIAILIIDINSTQLLNYKSSLHHQEQHMLRFNNTTLREPTEEELENLQEPKPNLS